MCGTQDEHGTLVLKKSRLPPCARKLMKVSLVLRRRSSSALPPAAVPVYLNEVVMRQRTAKSKSRTEKKYTF